MGSLGSAATTFRPHFRSRELVRRLCFPGVRSTTVVRCSASWRHEFVCDSSTWWGNEGESAHGDAFSHESVHWVSVVGRRCIYLAYKELHFSPRRGALRVACRHKCSTMSSDVPATRTNWMGFGPETLAFHSLRILYRAWASRSLHVGQTSPQQVVTSFTVVGVAGDAREAKGGVAGRESIDQLLSMNEMDHYRR